MMNVAPFAEHAPFCLPRNSTPNAIRKPGRPTLLRHELDTICYYSIRDTDTDVAQYLIVGPYTSRLYVSSSSHVQSS